VIILNNDEKMEMRLKVAIQNEIPIDSMRLIRECFNAFADITVSQSMIDRTILSYLGAYEKLEKLQGYDNHFAVRIAGHAFEMLNRGASKEVVEKLHNFCIDRRLYWSAQRVQSFSEGKILTAVSCP
jgi:hypothetical protein